MCHEQKFAAFGVGRYIDITLISSIADLCYYSVDRLNQLKAEGRLDDFSTGKDNAPKTLLYLRDGRAIIVDSGSKSVRQKLLNCGIDVVNKRNDSDS